MAPSLFKGLRRRSKASFRTEDSTDTSSEGVVSHGTAPSTGSLTPPSIAHQSDPALNFQVKPSNASNHSLPRSVRPPLGSKNNSSRHSVGGMSGLGTPPASGQQHLPVSKYAPNIHNLSDNAWVYQKALLVYGTIGETSKLGLDGTLTVSTQNDEFPAISWPVCDSHFKALIYLQPGPNRLKFDFSTPKMANSTTSNRIHASHLTVHMMPTNNAPPLQLAILLAKDSPATFDVTPARLSKEGNGLNTAIRKFRMAAYLWQAFTAEQMWRNKLGRRSFRFEEEWTSGSAAYHDLENGIMRSEARVHVIRSDKTLAELRDLDKAQQYEQAADKNALFAIAAEAARKHFNPLPGQKQYISMLLLDSHWDKDLKAVTGHAAVGGERDGMHLAIYGSHCLQSYPSTFEEVVPAFTDCTPTDTNYVSNDGNDAGSSWEAANIGIGAHLHQIGHLFGCPHQESGVMLRDYLVLNRSFVPREAYSTRTKTKGGLALQGDECEWHRLDCLRFRAHPAFRLPNDPPTHADDSVQAFSTESGKIVVLSKSGISFVEIFADRDDVCRSWIEYPLDRDAIRRQVALDEQELRARLPDVKNKARLKVVIKSHGGGSLTIEDFNQFNGKRASRKLFGGKQSYRSNVLGESRLENSQPQEVVFSSSEKQERVLSRIAVYHDPSAVFGMEFYFDDDSSQLFGVRDANGVGDWFDLDVRRGEYISGFNARAGSWIDGIQILTSLGRKSPMYGNVYGGSSNCLIPPRGYTICGVSGSFGHWLDGFSVLITH